MSVKKLFCAGTGQSFRYGMHFSKQEATQALGCVARLPDPDDMRRVWFENKLHEKDSEEIQAMFGISRQALSLWRQKAGADVPRYSDHRAQQVRERIRAALDTTKTPAEIAEALGTSTVTVKEVAEQEGVVLAQKHTKKPDDDEIVRLSAGRTWRQLAEVCNVSLQTLRHYVYAHPELAERVRKGIVYEPAGATAHGRIDVDKLVEMYESGQSPYAISKHFGTEAVTIIYWLKKLEIYKPDRTTSGSPVTS